MSGTYVQTASETEVLARAPSRQNAFWRWAARVAVLLIALWIVAEGISLTIQYTRLNRILTAQIAAAMGRAVEVGSYRFSFWDGPVIEARNVTVDEDPRFGAEYFVRADSMAVRLRWLSLLRGHLEFGTISLTRPSLNLVRNSAGDWNLAEWLPRPNSPAAPRGFTGPIPLPRGARFHRIEVDGGRINFKLQDLKLPFAFVGVNGAIDAAGPGRWRIDLQASPWRAAVLLQQVGTIHLSGDVGGTSSRLLPAALNLNWPDASLPDILRLARENDFGIRGSLSLALDAHTIEPGSAWTVHARATLLQIHRWDLPLRPDNPSLNLDAQLGWQPGAPYVDLTQATIEGPHSNIQVAGRVYYAKADSAAKRPVPSVGAVSPSATLDANDLLAWLRAFRPGISDGLVARGTADVHAALAGWPPHVAHAEISTTGVDLTGSPVAKPVHVGRLQLRYDGSLFSASPLNVSWGAADSHSDASFRIENAAKPASDATRAWRVSGYANQARDVISGFGAFGWNVARGWDFAGPFSCDLRWQFPHGSRFADSLRQPSGWMEFGAPASAGGATLRAPFLNLPIEQISARVDLKPGVRQVKLTSAEAFSARWTGTFERRAPGAPWQFNLSADRLSTMALDRWLNPRWRESFLDRMLPFLNSRSGSPALPESLQANGRLSVDRFLVNSLILSRLQGDLAVHGRQLSLTNASAQFYAGQLSGSFDATLKPVPSYRTDLSFSRVDLAALASASPNLAGLFAGNLDGTISLETQGASRPDLISNLVCQGKAHVSSPKLRNLDLENSTGEAALPTGSSLFTDAGAAFTCANRSIQFQDLDFVSVDTGVAGTGAVDFRGSLDLRLHNYSASSSAPENAVRVTGTLAAPQFTTIPAGAAARSSH